MSQQSVFNFLKKHKGKKFTTTQINKRLHFENASDNLKTLRRFGEIRREIRRGPWGLISYYWYEE